MVTALGKDAPSYQVVNNSSREFRCGRTTTNMQKVPVGLKLYARRKMLILSVFCLNKIVDSTTSLAEITRFSNGTLEQ